MIPSEARVRLLAACRATVAALALGACGSASDATGPASSELQRAVLRWQAHRPAAYRYTLERSCYCLDRYTTPIVIEVHGATATAAHFESSGEAVAVPSTLAPPIEELFARVADALSRDADHVDAHYDDARGYPTRVFIDYRARSADDELGFTVRDFHAVAE